MTGTGGENPIDPGVSDLAMGSFSTTPPWTMDSRRPSWQPLIPLARWDVHRKIGVLLGSGRSPGPRIGHVVRHLGSALARWAVGARRRGGTASRADISRRLRVAAEQLGPTYIKLGQIISSGEGLFPPELVSEFKRCRDQVPAEPFDAIVEVIEEELGRAIDDVFATIDPEPLAAASIAQVHAATLITGESVVVKVQRPAIAQLVEADIRAMAWLAPMLIGRIPVAALANPPALVELFAQTIAEELDFRLEAQNMLDVARSFADLGQRGFVIPRPHPDLVTPRVLVMERLNGFAFEDVEGMHAAGIDTQAVVRTGMIGFMEGAMINGIFHGDLHGGNLMVMDDGRVGLLDFGITGRMTEPQRLTFMRLMMSASANDSIGQLAALRDLGALPPDTDLEDVSRDLGLDRPAIDPLALSAEEMIHEVQRITKALLGYGARLPKELMLFVKNMVFLDGAIATLAPDLDLLAELAYISTHFVTTYGERIAHDIGLSMEHFEVDLSAVSDTLGVDPTTEKFSYRDLQARRELIRSRMHSAGD